MLFDRLKDPARCAAPEDTRYSVSGCALLALDGKLFLAATDGRSLSLIAAEREATDTAEPGACFPGEAFDAARKAARSGRPARVDVNGKAAVLNKDGSRSEWPALDRAFPPIDRGPRGVIPTGKPVHVLCFDAQRMADMQRALGAEAVRVEVFDDGRPMIVHPIYSLGGTKASERRRAQQETPSADGSFGVVMPVSAD